MHGAPGREACPLPCSPFKSCTMPRSISWRSTVDCQGRANLAPCSQWQNLTFDPPLVMLAANPYADGRRNHTVLSAEATAWFVWTMATSELREAVNISAVESPDVVDEFAQARVTKARCIDAPGRRVADSPSQFECRYLASHRLAGRSAHDPVEIS